MATGRVVEAFDELKDGHPRLAVRSEAAPIDQLAVEGGEETLAHRIVVGVADRACRWTNAGFLQRAPKATDVYGRIRDGRAQHLDGSCDEHSRTALGAFCGGCACSSPGRPRRQGDEERRRFWAAIAAGTASERCGSCRCRQVGRNTIGRQEGMRPIDVWAIGEAARGRYLSLAEREEIALLRVQGYSMQEVAGRLGRVASTMSGATAGATPPTKRRPRVSCDWRAAQWR